MKNKNQSVSLAVFTIITIIVWIITDLYHISLSSTIPEDMKQVVIPLNPNLDTKIFELIKTKKNPSEFSSGNPLATDNESSTSANLLPTNEPQISTSSGGI